MDTKDFRTKTVFLERNNISADGFWPVALDIGYSSVKGFSPNNVYCFPSFARKFTGQLLSVGEPADTDIQYRDESGTWNVGQSAQSQISSDDTNDGITTLFGRNRYFSPMFLVLARTGLGMGMIANGYGNPNGKKLFLQTGLPPAYLKGDAKYLKEVLATRHKFELRVGKGKWHRFDFELNENSIRVMSQPMGSLLSAAIDNDCKQIPDGESMLTSNVLIFDGGFGTLDIFDCRNRVVDPNPPSFDDLGMKAVLMETCKNIYKKYGEDIQIHAMQKVLEEGFVTVFDPRNMKTEEVPFTDILEEANKKICYEALGRLKVMYSMQDYNYLLVTGGTGAAWKDLIADYFSGMKKLNVISGTQNDTLSDIFSNVRGYYLWMVGYLRKVSAQKS